MAYFALADVSGRIPGAFLAQALDDDGDGVIDADAKVIAEASGQVDALVGTRYEVPRPSPEPLVIEAAKVAFCYLCYQRRGVGDAANPWNSRYQTLFGNPDEPNFEPLLIKVALGKVPLAPGAPKVNSTASKVTEKSSVFDTAGRRLS